MFLGRFVLRRKARIYLAWALGCFFLWHAAPTPASLLVGALPISLGFLLRGWAAGYLEKDRELCANGPYAWVRHPLYLGTLAISLGAIIAGASVWLALPALALAPIYAAEMRSEDRTLLRKFGNAHLSYARRVPALLPRFWGRRPKTGGVRSGPGRFSFARYARNREYEAGAAGLAAALFLAWRTFGG